MKLLTRDVYNAKRRVSRLGYPFTAVVKKLLFQGKYRRKVKSNALITRSRANRKDASVFRIDRLCRSRDKCNDLVYSIHSFRGNARIHTYNAHMTKVHSLEETSSANTTLLSALKSAVRIYPKEKRMLPTRNTIVNTSTGYE